MPYRRAPACMRFGFTHFRAAAQADVFFSKKFSRRQKFYVLRAKSVARTRGLWYNLQAIGENDASAREPPHSKITYGLVVKRLRRRPLTAQSRVRFPARSPCSPVHSFEWTGLHYERVRAAEEGGGFAPREASDCDTKRGTSPIGGRSIPGAGNREKLQSGVDFRGQCVL